MIEVVVMPRTVHRASPCWVTERPTRWSTSRCGLAGRDPEWVTDTELWALVVNGRRLCGHRVCFSLEWQS